MKKITLLIFCLWVSLFLQAQNYDPNSYQLENVTLSQQEKELYDLIMEYRQEQGLPKIPISKSLTYVAQLHAWDLQENQPQQGDCNLHSWSKNGTWTACCYTSDHVQAQCMWDKPKELADYSGYGYEISHFHTILTPSTALSSWQNSAGHNAVILNEGNWSKRTWNAIGIGIYGNYAHVWFGEQEDVVVLNNKPSNEPKAIEDIKTGCDQFGEEGTTQAYLTLLVIQPESAERRYEMNKHTANMWENNPSLFSGTEEERLNAIAGLRCYMRLYEEYFGL